MRRKAQLEELEQARREALEQAQLLSAVGDATPTLLVVIESPDGTLSREPVNTAYQRQTGLTQDECAHTCFWETVFAPEDALEGELVFRGVVAGDAPEARLSRWRRKDGSTFECEWTCTPMPPVGELQPFLVTGIDMTDRRRQEAELRRSRARLVAAADEERRRLERNLHDGAQQRLVTLSLTLRLAQAKLASDPGEANAILEGAAAELVLALDELRELARGLHPAILTERGLAAAAQSLAARVPVPVEVDNRLERRLPEQVEVALFYVIAEALTNVAKYAQAASAAVRLLHDGRYATAEIGDDGIGGADPARGSGLRGLRDRVEALDGELTVQSEAGSGTTVTARIPALTPTAA